MVIISTSIINFKTIWIILTGIQKKSNKNKKTSVIPDLKFSDI